MLGKLIKYEFKATTRIFVPLYLALIVLSIINRFFFTVESDNVLLNVPLFFSKAAYFIGIVAISFLTFIIIVQRFYKNMVTDEGYLMFTLPVKSGNLVLSKLIAASVWFFASILLVLASLLFVFLTKENLQILTDGIKNIWNTFTGYFGAQSGLIVAETITSTVLGIISSILMAYTAIAIGQLYTRHKLIGSILAYVGLNIVIQMISSIMMLVIGFADPGIINGAPADWLIHVIMTGSLLLNVLIAIACYITTNVILTRKLNLE